MTGTYAGLARRVLAAPARLGGVRAVMVDGPAGSGKTTFAARLARALRVRGRSVAEIHTDDLLEGWTGLETYWPRLEEQILQPLCRGDVAHYRRYDWERERFTENPTVVVVPDVLLVEGVASARAASRPYRSLAVYVHADRTVRLDRGVARDGERLRGEWLRWMAAEERHFAADDTARWADVLVDGSPVANYDPDSEFVLLPRSP
jgi:uridine kinase